MRESFCKYVLGLYSIDGREGSTCDSEQGTALLFSGSSGCESCFSCGVLVPGVSDGVLIDSRGARS